jgi:hypothetical protein
MRIPFIGLIAASSIALGGCAYGDLGFGLGYGSDYGYGYGSPYYGGYGYGSPYGGYYGGYGSGYGYSSPYFGYGYSSSRYGGFGSPYFGWYDNYYYPGSGYYVYDNYRRPHRWSDRQRGYWTNRLRSSGTTTTKVTSPNWSGFNPATNYTMSRQTTGERINQARTRVETRRIERQSRPDSNDERPNRPRRR